jgi:hypothetical protein
MLTCVYVQAKALDGLGSCLRVERLELLARVGADLHVVAVVKDKGKDGGQAERLGWCMWVWGMGGS